MSEDSPRVRAAASSRLLAHRLLAADVLHNRMKDLHPSDDGETYFELVAGFVHRRIGAHEFIPQFFRLRHRDDTIVMPGVARTF